MADGPVDEYGKELEERIRANEALIRGIKYDLGQQVLVAQEGGGEMPPPAALEKVSKLEIALQNLKMFAEARAMTRRPHEGEA